MKPGTTPAELHRIPDATFLLAAMWLGNKLIYRHGMRVTGQSDHDERATRRG